jgi:hypothetical protein
MMGPYKVQAAGNAAAFATHVRVVLVRNQTIQIIIP